MTEDYTLNELFMISEHRKIDVLEYRMNHSGYKDEVKNDRTTFFSYMKRIGLEELIKEYLEDKQDCLDKSFKILIDYIFKISTTGRAKTYQDNNSTIEMRFFENKSGKEVCAIQLGDIDKDKVRQKIRKGINTSDFSDKDLNKAYEEICIILKAIFNQETKELKDKYNQKLEETDIIIFHDSMCAMECMKELGDLPKRIMENSNITRDQKYDLINQLENDYVSLLNKWDDKLFLYEPKEVKDEVIGFFDPNTGSFKINKEIIDE